MKNFILAFVSLFCIELIAQQLPVNCNLAVPGCSTPQFPVVGVNPAYNTVDFGTATNSNPNTNPSSGNAGCLLSGETVSTFVTINVVSNGILEWSMIGATATGCFDWIMWENTATNGGCAGINGNTLPPVSCNWNGMCNGNTGMASPGNIPPGGDQSSYEPGIAVVAGQSFILCLSNYSYTTQLVNLDFFGTAEVSCTPSTPDQTICEGETATVNILTFGMPSPSYNWLVSTGVSNVSSGSNVSVTPTQTTQYIVEITSTTTVVLDTFMIYVVLPPTPNAGPDANVCLGQPIPLDGTLTDIANTFTWTHDISGVTPVPTVNYVPNATILDPNVVVNQLGTYIFTLSEDNGICPAVMDEVEITISSTIHVTSFVPPSCFGQADGSITITNPDAVEYSYDNGLTFVPNATITGLTTGAYTVISRNQYGCIYTSSVTIAGAAQLYAYAGNDTLICENGTANLWASTSSPTMAVDYHWSHNPALTANATISPTSDTIVYVYAEGPGGCISDTVAINIAVVLPPTPDAGPDALICLGQPIPLNGTLTDIANTFTWTHDISGVTPTPTVNYLPNATTINPNVDVNQSGTYIFTLSEDNGICPAVVDEVEITISSTTHSTSYTLPSCFGQADASITITNPDAVEYSYDNGLTFVPNATITGLTTGAYTVISRNQYGCIYTSSVTIAGAAQLYAYAGNDTLICENGTANLWASTSAPAMAVDYHWSHNPALTANATISPTSDTTVYVYAEGPGGCISDTVAINITVREPLTGLISSNVEVCAGIQTTLGVNTLAGGIGAPYDIVWSTGDIGSGIAMGISIIPSGAATYTATITDACESTPLVLTTESIMAPLPVPLMAEVLGLCEPAVFELNNLTDPAMVQSYSWNISDGQSYVNTNSVLTDEMPSGSYSVQLTVTSPQGCVASVWFYDWLVSYQNPEAAFSWSPNPVQIFNTTVQFSNQSYLAADYFWTFQDGNPVVSSIELPTSTFPTGVTGQYLVTLFVTSENGCVDSVAHIVPVLPEVIIYAPNTFTPDDDEYNQKWRLVLAGVDVMSFQLEIYNRWGEMVWESRDINAGWDGTYGGTAALQGGYTWKATARDSASDKKYLWSGHINILR